MAQGTATKTTRTAPRARTRPGAEAGAPLPEARMVGKHRVISDEPLVANLAAKGKPPVHLRIRVLGLDDGSRAFGCADCDYTAGTRGLIQGHRMTTHPGERTLKKKPVAAALTSDVLAMPLGELLDLATAVQHWEAVFAKQSEELEAWKARALAAEATVKRTTKALGQLGFAVKDD